MERRLVRAGRGAEQPDERPFGRWLSARVRLGLAGRPTVAETRTERRAIAAIDNDGLAACDHGGDEPDRDLAFPAAGSWPRIFPGL